RKAYDIYFVVATRHTLRILSIATINEMNFITKQLEKKLGVDLNGDGIIGSGYGRGGSLIGKVEEATHIDLNNDGRIGRGPAPFPNYPPAYNSYGGPPHPPNFQSGNQGMINELEKATNIDLNHDGRIGGGPAPFPNYPPAYNAYGGPPNFQSGNQGMINELEKATNIDLNHDGRIGGGPALFSNYNSYSY
ncbi:unnamed protein product, partial [Rotaria socialis]